MATLETEGYEVVDRVVGFSQLEKLVLALPEIGSAGSRCLLTIKVFSEVVESIAAHHRLGALVAGLLPLHCTYFRKTKDYNWSLKLHRDTVIPLNGIGPWASAGTKEGMTCVKPPRAFLDHSVAVRLSLDNATEGDLRLVEGSHLTSDSYLLSDTVAPPIIAGSALVLRPSTVHGSAKLGAVGSRRVLHYLFVPSKLPGSYYPYERVA